MSNTASKIGETSLTSSSDDSPSGFSKLSAEIRNMIYCLTLVSEAVVIQDLHPDEWQAKKDAGHATRTSYKTKDHIELNCSYHPDYEMLCTLDIERFMDAKVSYTLCRDPYWMTPNVVMLALNRQIRSEAVPIFYGRNKFFFWSMSAMVPFLKDRSELSLQSMKYFILNLEVDRPGYQKCRQDGWARAFAQLPNIGPLKLSKFTLGTNDPHCCYVWTLKLENQVAALGLYEIAKNITSLDMLGVTLDFQVYNSCETANKRIKKDSPSEALLWKFLAPKMLKKIGDEPHDDDSLWKRRIRVNEDGEDLDGNESGIFRSSAQ